MLPLVLAPLFFLFQSSNAQVDANGITLAEKAESLELRLLEPGTLDFGVSPCNKLLNSDPAASSGEQTAAQWVRIVR
jgi:hypothetical protein